MADQQQNERIRQEVRQRYGEIARRRGSSCCSSASSSAASCCESAPTSSGASCCSSGDTEAFLAVLDKAETLGYSVDDLLTAPLGASMSLGCGNPGAIASLRPGEVVLDLGSGGGFDCLLAARQVGETGRVIGVDMTPDMLARARVNMAQVGLTNVEFRLGEIEHLPVADNSVDVIISNCVINLSPDKEAVFRDAYRVLKPGGRLAIADTVATAPLSEEMRQDMAQWASCIAGAAYIGDLEDMLKSAGFEGIRIQPKDESRKMIREWVPGRGVEEYVLSATIEAVKPGAA